MNTGFSIPTIQVESSIRSPFLDALLESDTDFGAFRLSSVSGTIQPDTVEAVSVHFEARGNEKHAQEIVLEIENAKSHRKQTMLLLKGISSIPTIDVSEKVLFESVPFLNQISQSAFGYCSNENTLSFGTVLTKMEGVPSTVSETTFLKRKECFEGR